MTTTKSNTLKQPLSVCATYIRTGCSSKNLCSECFRCLDHCECKAQPEREELIQAVLDFETV